MGKQIKKTWEYNIGGCPRCNTTGRIAHPCPTWNLPGHTAKTCPCVGGYTYSRCPSCNGSGFRP